MYIYKTKHNIVNLQSLSLDLFTHTPNFLMRKVVSNSLKIENFSNAFRLIEFDRKKWK